MGLRISRSPYYRGKLLAEILRAARASEPCPGNRELGETLGCGAVTASAVLAGLEADGIVAVHRGNNSRVVVVTETGERTAGAIPEPHWRDRIGRMADDHVRAFRVERNRTMERRRREARRDAPAPTLADLLPPLPADRTPCPRCGIRADIGCRHLLGHPGALAGEAMFA